MKHSYLKIILCTICSLSTHFAFSQEYTATLAGHIIIPANTTIPNPKDADINSQTSGKYIEAYSLDRHKKIEGTSEGRPTGSYVPIEGQPIQGFSGIKKMTDSSYWIITDNGAGKKKNSSDFLLYLNQYHFDFKNSKEQHLQTLFLRDPFHKVPFRIVQESTKQRYLTGADFDPESFQWVGDNLWVGEEFGPFLIKLDKQGRVLRVFDTEVDGKKIQSPDNPYIPTLSSPDESANFNLKRSKGFEGMALSPDKTKLYALLEGPIYQAEQKSFEQKNGKSVLRMLEFDLITEKWTGRSWLYPLEHSDLAIGDFNMINHNTALIIERDEKEGVAEYACKSGQDPKTCYANPAVFKRIYKIRFDNSSNQVKKLAFINLLNIQDPKALSKRPLNNGKFTFPFITVENVDVVDQNHIIVGNDNNFPFSAGRQPNKQDDNEIILLDVGDFLK